MAVLEFIFQDFWHWFGSLILFTSIAAGIGGVFHRD
jgi:hypothetical protein